MNLRGQNLWNVDFQKVLRPPEVPDVNVEDDPVVVVAVVVAAAAVAAAI